MALTMHFISPGPMSNLTTLETGAWIVAVFGGSTTTVRKFNANFVAHEVAFMIFGDALLCSLPAVKFLWWTLQVDAAIYVKSIRTTKP